jgi:hypothetical protein
MNTNKLIAACYQDPAPANQRTLDSKKDYESSDIKKGRSSRLFNQSFYDKAPSQTGFDKIHHEDSVKKIDKATV